MSVEPRIAYQSRLSDWSRRAEAFEQSHSRLGNVRVCFLFGLLALAAFAQNWALRQNTPVERGLLLLSGLLLVFPSLIEAIVESIIGRDISYTYVPGLIIGLGVVLWQARTRAPTQPALTT